MVKRVYGFPSVSFVVYSSFALFYLCSILKSLSMHSLVLPSRYFLAFAVVSVVTIVVTILKNAGRNLIILRMRLYDIEAHALPQLGGAGAVQFAEPLLRKRFMIAAARMIFVL